MELIYVDHSCYAILGDNITIIIDYYKDSDNNPEKGVVQSQLLTRKGDLYILSTHSHHDHFNPIILEWSKVRKDIKYIFNKEIKESIHPDHKGVVYLDKLEEYTDNNISVKAYGSTDLGGSFLIKIDDKTIFHAGDLNNWHWKEESTGEEIEEAENYFANELAILTTDVHQLDLAMFPIDPRLGKEYMKGAQQFVDAIHVRVLAPMHFQGEYAKAAAFADYAAKRNCKLITWTDKNQNTNF